VCSAIIGGAVQSAGTVTLMYTALDSNTAKQSGGALHSTATGVITAANCTFTNNQVHSHYAVLVLNSHRINAAAACLYMLIAVSNATLDTLANVAIQYAVAV
jgi:predicted outer membrane repeat protein